MLTSTFSHPLCPSRPGLPSQEGTFPQHQCKCPPTPPICPQGYSLLKEILDLCPGYSQKSQPTRHPNPVPHRLPPPHPYKDRGSFQQPLRAWLPPPQVKGPVHTTTASLAPSPRSQRLHSHSPSESGSCPPRSEAPSTSPREPGSHPSITEAPATQNGEPGSRPPHHPLRSEALSTQPQGARLLPPRGQRP